MNKTDQTFETLRPRLQGLAYRLTGSLHEAEDLVQESWLRWQQSSQADIREPFAWLSTVVTRLALDHMGSAAEKRKRYIGPWLPEPYTRPDAEPEALLELDQSISTALLFVLEQLTPAERASFILHDIFSFSFDEVATILGKNAAACRQLASRSRAKIQQRPTQSSVSPDRHKSMLEAFFNAARHGNTERLLALLSDDVAFYADGGGKVPAIRKVLIGPTAVIDFVQRVVQLTFQRASEPPRYEMRYFNGAPGLLLYLGDTLVTAYSCVITESGISQIYALRNPDKLRLLEASTPNG